MAQREAWLAQQAYDGALHALERHGRSRRDAQMAKANLATLSESIMTRLCRIAGGGAYSCHSPLGYWFEDVRAAGFLRPPWSVALEGLYAIGWEGPANSRRSQCRHGRPGVYRHQQGHGPSAGRQRVSLGVGRIRAVIGTPARRRELRRTADRR